MEATISQHEAGESLVITDVAEFPAVDADLAITLTEALHERIGYEKGRFIESYHDVVFVLEGLDLASLAPIIHGLLLHEGNRGDLYLTLQDGTEIVFEEQPSRLDYLGILGLIRYFTDDEGDILHRFMRSITQDSYQAALYRSSLKSGVRPEDSGLKKALDILTKMWKEIELGNGTLPDAILISFRYAYALATVVAAHKDSDVLRNRACPGPELVEKCMDICDDWNASQAPDKGVSYVGAPYNLGSRQY